jgi:2-phospho-L-lactate/phosphoenolpyruvate guanylyltransferase
MRGAILVPIKEHARAKSRLAAILTPQERSILAWAMFEDLALALGPQPWPVFIVTNSNRIADRVARLGWQILWEENQSSESHSVDAASRRLALQGIESILRLPADLPLIQTQDVIELLSLAIHPSCAILAPSGDCLGTNALLRTPPDLFPSRFGADSFRLHLLEAVAAKAEIHVVENPRLALDLDDPSDISRFLVGPPDGITYRTLMEFNITERLARHAVHGDPDLGLAGNS